MSEHVPSTEAKKGWDGNINGLKILGQGATAFVFAIDRERVVKIPAGFDMSIRAVERERAVFERLDGGRPTCQHVLWCLDLWNPRGLVLERCVETVRQYVQSYDRAFSAQVAIGEKHSVPRWERQEVMKESMKWAYQAAKGISFLHDKGILHADVGCHNLLLDGDHNVKVSDFSGSVILNGPTEYTSALVSYDARSQKPGVSKTTEQTDIFALGSVVYELATGHLPYAELQDFQVAHRFDMHKWPEDLWSIMASQQVIADTIQGCWEGHFEHADDVAWEIKAEWLLQSPPPEVDSDDTDSIAPSDEDYTHPRPSSPEILESPPPEVASDDADSVSPKYAYLPEPKSRSYDAYYPEPKSRSYDASYPKPKPRSSEKRSHRRKRKTTEKKTKREVSFFGKFFTCLGIRHASSANRKASYRSYPSW